jgi:hypothetical protein
MFQYLASRNNKNIEALSNPSIHVSLHPNIRTK